MDCTRCGGGLDTYELNGCQAMVCESCGFVDVPVEHEPNGENRESWGDAFERFDEQKSDLTVDDLVRRPVPSYFEQ